jgi:hypothetical protein
MTAVIGLTFPMVHGAIGFKVFFLFAIACCVGAIFVALGVVETKEKTKEDIAQSFQRVEE